MCAPDAAHAATADLRFDQIGAKLSSGERDAVVCVRPQRLICQELCKVGTFAQRQQLPDATGHPGLAFGEPRQPLRALGGVELQRAIEVRVEIRPVVGRRACHRVPIRSRRREDNRACGRSPNRVTPPAAGPRRRSGPGFRPDLLLDGIREAQEIRRIRLRDRMT